MPSLSHTLPSVLAIMHVEPWFTQVRNTHAQTAYGPPKRKYVLNSNKTQKEQAQKTNKSFV